MVKEIYIYIYIHMKNRMRRSNRHLIGVSEATIVIMAK